MSRRKCPSSSSVRVRDDYDRSRRHSRIIIVLAKRFPSSDECRRRTHCRGSNDICHGTIVFCGTQSDPIVIQIRAVLYKDDMKQVHSRRLSRFRETHTRAYTTSYRRQIKIVPDGLTAARRTAVNRSGKFRPSSCNTLSRESQGSGADPQIYMDRLRIGFPQRAEEAAPSTALPLARIRSSFADAPLHSPAFVPRGETRARQKAPGMLTRYASRT